MEWSIQQVAKLAGTTSRTLRHYGDAGILEPSRIGANGYRYYDEDALLRLQRILLLRDLGLGLAEIAAVLARRTDEVDALETHREQLIAEREFVDRRIVAVESTIAARRRREPLMAAKMFDGFDHTEYREEVETRWGASAYERSDSWWRGMDESERREWQARVSDLSRDWTDAAARGVAPDSAEAQALAERHIAWLRGIPGTPTGEDFAAYVSGLADMYVADPRFAANYGGESGAALVRDALRRREASPDE